MFDLLFPYLAATVATAIAMSLAALAYSRHQSAALRYEALEQKLPDACRLQNIQVLREQAQQELDSLRESVVDARHMLGQKQEAEKWLNANRQILLACQAEREEQERLRLELTQINKVLGASREQLVGLAKECQAAELNCNYLRQQEQQLGDEVRSLVSKRQVLIAEVEDLEKACLPLRHQLAGLRAEISANSNELQDARERLERSLAAFDRQIKQIESQLDAAQASLTAELQVARERCDRALATLDKQIEQLGSQRDSVQAQVRTAQEQLAAAEIHIGELQGLKSALSAELKGLEAQKESISQQLKLLRDDWQHLRIKTGQDEDTERQRTAELWQPVIAPLASSFAATKDQDELSCLENTQAYFRGLGLQFPQRVLWAFHTSLKVTDISPLVVLAGISGTGKSELPRRYAEAMGIHFLNVAVQPRCRAIEC